jgi:hypothetical protein
MKRCLPLLLLVAAAPCLDAQPTAEISGVVRDARSGEALPYAAVQLFRGGQSAGGTAAGPGGQYAFGGLEPGTYRLVATMVGYRADTLEVRAAADRVAFADPRPLPAGALGTVRVRARGLVEKGGDELVESMGAEELKHSPYRSPVRAIAQRAPRVHDRDGRGGTLHVAGSRADAVAYYVDGVRMIGSLDIPSGAVADVTLYAGGIPARYGDVTGGVIVVRTKSYLAFLD